MVKIIFTDMNGNALRERKWPAAPTREDGLTIAGTHYNVHGVYWRDDGTAVVRLRQMA